MTDWKAEARRWQRAFHALEDEKNYGKKIGGRIDPSKYIKRKKGKTTKSAENDDLGLGLLL